MLEMTFPILYAQCYVSKQWLLRIGNCIECYQHFSLYKHLNFAGIPASSHVTWKEFIELSNVRWSRWPASYTSQATILVIQVMRSAEEVNRHVVATFLSSSTEDFSVATASRGLIQMKPASVHSETFIFLAYHVNLLMSSWKNM
jgi:hypothetical protein